MKVLIIEDEKPAARQLSKLLLECTPEAEILEIIDSVAAAVKWLNTFQAPDLIFMDIQLADGLSFDIFRDTDIRVPVIFTTAYDQYALKAFKVNSIDYLLKPVDPEELSGAIQKFRNLNRSVAVDHSAIAQMVQSMMQKEYKERFLIKSGANLSYVPVTDIAYFFSEDGLAFAQTAAGRHILDYSLEELESLLNPKQYFRISRKMLVGVESIRKISPHFNGRLKLEIHPKYPEEVFVSRERVNDFKEWLDR